MTMHTQAANTMREIEAFVNANGISKQDIFSIIQVHDGTFMLTYFSED